MRYELCRLRQRHAQCVIRVRMAREPCRERKLPNLRFGGAAALAPRTRNKEDVIRLSARRKLCREARLSRKDQRGEHRAKKSHCLKDFAVSVFCPPQANSDSCEKFLQLRKLDGLVLGCINAKIPSTEWYGESFTTLRDLFVHSNL